MSHSMSRLHHGHSTHRIVAGQLIPGDEVRYHPTGVWQTVSRVRDCSTPAVASVRVEHVGTAPRWMSPSAYVEASYQAGAS